MNKMKILFPLALSLSMVFFYQNCGQTGGMTPFDDYYNPGDGGLSVCAGLSAGSQCNDLTVSITAAIGPQAPGNYNFSVQGACTYASGFANNRIHWVITSDYGYSAQGYVLNGNPCNGYGSYNTSFTVPQISGANFLNTKVHNLSVQLEATANTGDTFLSRPSNTYSVSGGAAYPTTQPLRQLVSAGSNLLIGSYQSYNLLDVGVPDYSRPYTGVTITLKVQTPGDVNTSLDPNCYSGVNFLEYYQNSTDTAPVFTLGSSRCLGTTQPDVLRVAVNGGNVWNASMPGNAPRIWKPNTVYTVSVVILRASNNSYTYKYKISEGNTVYATGSTQVLSNSVGDLGLQPMRLRVGRSMSMDYFVSPTSWKINELKSKVCGYVGGTVTPDTCDYL